MNCNRKNRNNRHFFWVLAVILWMCVIFALSAQPAEESSDLSGGVSYLVVKACSNVLGLNWDENQLLNAVETIEYPVRKAAHMTEYAILTLLTYGAWKSYGCKKVYLRSALALAITFLYACTDEFHQRFVPGRAGLFTDVMIDTLGGGAGLILFFLLWRICTWVQGKLRARRDSG